MSQSSRRLLLPVLPGITSSPVPLYAVSTVRNWINLLHSVLSMHVPFSDEKSKPGEQRLYLA
uniref:Uncharacterized protein n=1 Tax=Romanomermis culicivorax TaxID=13658 RepID=A0A915JW08_ROMCU